MLHIKRDATMRPTVATGTNTDATTAGTGCDARDEFSGRHTYRWGRGVADHSGWRQRSHMAEALGIAE
jgi:hypothetical protein